MKWEEDNRKKGLKRAHGRLVVCRTVRTDRPSRSVHKWYTSVRRTGSGRNGTALWVGPAGSLAPAWNVESAANFARFE